jgi:hypothetical protein
MTAFGAEELQKLRHASHVVYGSGIGLIGEVVDPATQREAISMDRNHTLDRQVQVELQRVAMRVDMPTCGE